jgi:Flp pilus assembly pilin Flp
MDHLHFDISFAAFAAGLALYRHGGVEAPGGTRCFRKTAVHWRRLTRQFSLFATTRRGATAVEFALIAPPFLAMLIAILEVTLILFAQQVLQNAAV